MILLSHVILRDARMLITVAVIIWNPVNEIGPQDMDQWIRIHDDIIIITWYYNYVGYK